MQSVEQGGEAAADSSEQGGDAAADGNEQGGDAADDGNEEQDKQDVAEPRKIGYKTFPNGHAAFKYYKMLLRELTKNQDLNGVCHCQAGHSDKVQCIPMICERVSFWCMSMHYMSPWIGKPILCGVACAV